MHHILFNPPIEKNFLGHQMAEIYRDEVYKPYMRKGMKVLDVGANIGLTTYYFSQFADKVFAIEPSLEHFDILSRMVKINKLENVVPIQKAIFMKSGKLPLFHNTNKTMFSLHRAVDDGTEKEELVDCITLEELFKNQKIDHIDLMKLDIEGSEYEVLSHSSFKNVADKIQTIVVERHNWAGRHPQQLVDALKLRNYKVESVPNSADLLVATK